MLLMHRSLETSSKNPITSLLLEAHLFLRLRYLHIGYHVTKHEQNTFSAIHLKST